MHKFATSSQRISSVLDDLLLWPLCGWCYIFFFYLLPEFWCFFQVSEDDSYISDVSDNISMDNFSNGTESDRQNSGTFWETELWNIYSWLHHSDLLAAF